MLTEPYKSIFENQIKLLEMHHRFYTEDGDTESEESQRLYDQCLSLKQKIENPSIEEEEIKTLVGELSTKLAEYTKSLFEIHRDPIDELKDILESERKKHTEDLTIETEESERLYEECLTMLQQLENSEDQTSAQINEVTWKISEYGGAPTNKVKHGTIIKLGNFLGYNLNEDGVCYGIAATAINMLMHSPEQFHRFEESIASIDRVYRTYHHIEVKYKKLKDDIEIRRPDDQEEQIKELDKQQKSEVEAHNKKLYELLTKETTDPNEISQKNDFLNALALIDNIKITFNPSREDVKFLFPSELKLERQSSGYDEAAAMLHPDNPSETANKLSSQVCIVESIHSLDSLQESIKQIENACVPPATHPVGILLGGNEHGISCTYDPMSKKWYLIDAERLTLPIRTTTSIDDVAEFIFKSVAKAQDKLVLSLEIVTTKDQKELLTGRLKDPWMKSERSVTIKEIFDRDFPENERESIFSNALHDNNNDLDYMNSIATAIGNLDKNNADLFTNEMLADVVRSPAISALFIKNNPSFFKENPVDCSEGISGSNDILTLAIISSNTVLINALLDRDDIDVKRAVQWMELTDDAPEGWQQVLTKAKTIMTERGIDDDNLSLMNDDSDDNENDLNDLQHISSREGSVQYNSEDDEDDAKSESSNENDDSDDDDAKTEISVNENDDEDDEDRQILAMITKKYTHSNITPREPVNANRAQNQKAQTSPSPSSAKILKNISEQNETHKPVRNK